MNNEVEKFDPSKLMQGVKDRIKSEFVSMIPDDQWSQMIEKEITEFFRTKESGYNHRVFVSDFSILVYDILKEECRKRMKEYLEGEEFQSVWNNSGRPQASEFIKKLFIDNSGEMLNNFFSSMFQSHLEYMRNNLM